MQKNLILINNLFIMRELKFRYIYQHEEDTIFPERSLEIADVNDSIWTLEQIAEWEPDNYIDACLSSSWKVIDINQYTWIKDKNGREIFEGDICRTHSNHWTWFYSDIDDWVVSFEWWKFLLTRTLASKRHIICHNISEGLEVIWNIYTNPSLIKDFEYVDFDFEKNEFKVVEWSNLARWKWDDKIYYDSFDEYIIETFVEWNINHNYLHIKTNLGNTYYTDEDSCVRGSYVFGRSRDSFFIEWKNHIYKKIIENIHENPE